MSRSDTKRIRQQLQAAKGYDNNQRIETKGSARLSSAGTTSRSQVSGRGNDENESRLLRDRFLEKLDTKYSTSARSGKLKVRAL